MSAFTSRANSAGLVPPISNDSLLNPALTSFVSSAARTERLRPSTIAGGVFAGTKMPLPLRDLEPGVTGLLERRHVGQEGGARGPARGERPQIARLNMRKRDPEDANRRRDLAAQEVLQGRRRALVRHMRELEIRRARQHHAGEMQHRARARRAV
jgi:hypothetical protein